MKRLFLFSLVIALLFCGCGKKLNPGDLMDKDTGKVYSLGDSKDVFDSAFGDATYSDITKEWSYLSDMLCVAFDEDNIATRIKANAETSRFSFFNFDFSKPIEDIKGRYSEYEMSGVTAYDLFFSEDGKPIDLKDAACLNHYIAHTLFVYNEDDERLNRKNGAYEFYFIELKDGLGLEKP